MSLSRKPLAPARSAANTYSSFSNVVTTTTRTAESWPSATICRVASMPSRSGIRTSISTTSGRWVRVFATACRPVAASADHLDVVGPLEQRPEPGPNERLVVGQQYADRHGSMSYRSSGARLIWKPPSGPGAGGSSPPTAAVRSRMPTRPYPSVAPPGDRTAPVVVDGTSSWPGLYPSGPSRCWPPRAARRWSGPPARSGTRSCSPPPAAPTTGPPVSTVTVSPAERAMAISGSRWLISGIGVRGSPSPSSFVRSTPTAARTSPIASRLVGQDRGGGLPDGRRPVVGQPVLDHPGLDAQRRDRVGEHVVQLAGDAQPLLLDAALGVLLTFGRAGLGQPLS